VVAKARRLTTRAYSGLSSNGTENLQRLAGGGLFGLSSFIGTQMSGGFQGSEGSASLMSNALSIVLGFIGGIVAWFATNYYGRNLLRFWDQRLEIHKAFFLSKPMPSCANLLQLAADMDSLRVVLPSPLKWFLSIRGYDLRTAAEALKMLSRAKADEIHESADFRVQVQESLRLPVEAEQRELAERYRRLKGKAI
jgi:hypothetical protein